MSSADAPSPTPRQAPIALWRVAEAFLHTLHNLFGAPEDVAGEHTLTAKAHKLLASWLRCAEAMLRRLILIEAAHLPEPTRAPPRASRQRERRLMHFTADKPEEWRVSFRVFATADRRLPAGIPALQHAQTCDDWDTACRLEAGAPRESKRFYDAFPLAERYEALIRVFNDPIPYARRLARRLRAAPKRIHEALAAPKEAQHRIDDFDIMGHQAETAWRPHFSSA